MSPLPGQGPETACGGGAFISQETIPVLSCSKFMFRNSKSKITGGGRPALPGVTQRQAEPFAVSPHFPFCRGKGAWATAMQQRGKPRPGERLGAKWFLGARGSRTPKGLGGRRAGGRAGSSHEIQRAAEFRSQAEGQRDSCHADWVERGDGGGLGGVGSSLSRGTLHA